MSTSEIDLIMAAQLHGNDGDLAAVHKIMGELVRLRLAGTVGWKKLEILEAHERRTSANRAQGVLTPLERSVLKVYRWPSPDVPPQLPSEMK